MTRNQLIEALAAQTHVTKAKTLEMLEALTEIVMAKVAGGEKVSITRLGTFDLGSRAARHGVDPQTHANIEIPEMAMPRFRAGGAFKRAVRRD